jgi:hypothetical protein
VLRETTSRGLCGLVCPSHTGWRLGSGVWCLSDRGGTFGVAGLGERRRLAGTTSRSPSTTYVPSSYTGRNLASLDPRMHRINAMRCVCVVEEVDGKVMQP